MGSQLDGGALSGSTPPSLEQCFPASEGAPVRAASPDEWRRLAAGRAHWLLWGKSRPDDASLAHPLLLHCIDVAAVACVLLAERLPNASARTFLGLHESPESALRFLAFLIALHDLGKATPAFQRKAPWAPSLLREEGFDFRSSTPNHSKAGLSLLAPALESAGLRGDCAARYAHCVVAHHGTFVGNEYLDPGRLGRKARGGQTWRDARAALIGALTELLRLDDVDVSGLRYPTHGEAYALAGLTSMADWLGSMQEHFPYEAPLPPDPSALPAYFARARRRARVALDAAGFPAPRPRAFRVFTDLFPEYEPWPLHVQAQTLAEHLEAPSLFVVEAPMGEGKTEASLLLADAAAAKLGQQGLFLGLPTRATANQLFGRIRRFLERTRTDEPANLLLAHGEASLVDAFARLRFGEVYGSSESADEDVETGGVRAEAWFCTKKRTLLAEHAVGTIDQALLAVMGVRHAFVRYAGLAGKVVILDEVHAYDTYTGTLLDRLVEWLGAAGTTVVLLSATLPSSRRRQLLDAYRRGARTVPGATIASASTPDETTSTAYPRITTASAQGIHSVSFGPRGRATSIRLGFRDEGVERLAARILDEVARGGNVGWICNTVDAAQRAYQAIAEQAPELQRLLLHSRLFPPERLRREEELERLLGRRGDRPERSVVVGTQVLEQSLDVDFDLLVTDLAPVDLVLQRAGRLFRHDRDDRHPVRTRAELWVVAPADEEPSVEALRQVAAVYDELPLRRTLDALRGRSHVELPGDIEPLVERVYDPAILPAAHAHSAAQQERLGRGAAQRSSAEQRLLPHADAPDDFLGELRLGLEDEEAPSLHADRRAQTRDARDSVTVVCLEQRGGEVWAGERVIDLDVVPDAALQRALVERSISISRPAVVRALVEDPAARPTAWERVALLRHRRVVRFDNGVAEVGGVALHLDPDLGLVLESPRGRGSTSR
ncbi:MAG TPA: CRISPR-associated helicase Cas3' [Polyangiaceae bacterium LLY-WYZ-15_(1-7)]|nr:CRISPR-associated helicase Cas3' [Polyangiaceae bacterium LLY-WYZ-15_(1-7)]HJL35519.1 CRISPR-associated helicase Cas3' [Polyangiaceae bacterium LLY-WYZ-15_(1-7)]